MNEFKRAVTYTTAAIKHFHQGGSRVERARALSVRGMCLWHLRDDLAALADLREAAGLYQESRDDRSRAAAINHLGIVHRSLGMYEEALACLKESPTLSKRFKDGKGLGKCLNSLGTAHWWLIAATKKRTSHTSKGLTANNMGYVYLEKGEYHRLIRHLLEPDRFAEPEAEPVRF